MQCFAETPSVPLVGKQPKLTDYDFIIVAFSGGKDSIACFLHLLEEGVDLSKVELWHHEIDGREGGNRFLMDWPCTPSYCRAFADSFDVPIWFSWREGGFSREFGRNDTPTAPVAFEDSEGKVHRRGGKGPKNTRGKFPQVCADLSKRWCSAYLKIDVASLALRNQPRFQQAKTLIITGERGEESAARAKYARLEADRSDARKGKLGRHVDHWRPIQDWKEADVWDILARNRVAPPPAYQLGWSRLSCLFCIFGNADQWASARYLDMKGFHAIAEHEAGSGLTIHRKHSVIELANQGQPYKALVNDPQLAIDVRSSDPWTRPVRLKSPGDFRLPCGAFGKSCGPS